MRNFSNAKRIVIKIGTNILTRNSGVDTAYVRRIVKQIIALLKTSRQVVIVTSGAIGMGAGRLDIAERPKTTKMQQACAAIGQPLLMQEYRKAFLRENITVAQVLLTKEVLNNRKTYLNLRNSIETLLKLGVVPVINENDSVSTDEIGSAFGDNDKLSATGGMKTKIEAAQIASNAGCRIVLANGRVKNALIRIVEGEEIGTVFMPKRKLSNRKRWILNSTAVGTINIDEGAVKAVRNNKSLLPSGVISVTGSFEAGAVVMLNDLAKAVTSFASSQLKTLVGRHTSEIAKILGPGHRDVVAIPEDIVFLDY